MGRYYMEDTGKAGDNHVNITVFLRTIQIGNLSTHKFHFKLQVAFVHFAHLTKYIYSLDDTSNCHMQYFLKCTKCRECRVQNRYVQNVLMVREANYCTVLGVRLCIFLCSFYSIKLL